QTAALHVDPRVRTFLTPMIRDGEEAYAERLLEICRDERIDLVIPLMDFELPVLSRSKERFREIGTRVWVSDPQITATCLDKRATYEFCRDTEIRMPHSWFGELGPEVTFPVIRKKILGSGSVGQR